MTASTLIHFFRDRAFASTAAAALGFAFTAPAHADLNNQTLNLVNAGNHLCADNEGGSAANGNPVMQYSCVSGNKNQEWTALANADGAYAFVNVLTGSCIDVPGASTVNGVKLQQYACNGTSAQSFQAVSTGAGTYKLVNTNSGLCIDVPASSTAQGTQLQQYTCNGTNAQNVLLNAVSGSASSVGSAGSLTPIPVASAGTTNLPITQVSASSNTTLESTGAPSDWGYNSAGSFVEYTLNTAVAGNYQLVLHYAAWANTGVNVFVNGSQVGSVSFANQTGSYSTYADSAPLGITLPAGTATIQLVGQNAGYNLSGISLVPSQLAPASSSAFYVSPSGSDANTGTSPSTAFQTLEKAQTAMQALGMAPYTTYVMGGTYNRTQSLNLSGYYDQHKSWIAYPGQTPILDGGGAAIHGIDISGSTIAVQGLTLQNFQSGIYASYADHISINHNILNNINSPDWRTNVLGSSIFFLRVNTSTISQNIVNGNNKTGIEVNGGGAGDDNSFVTVSDNIVNDTCKGVIDCGAIYFRDLGHISTGQVISGNTVMNFHPNTTDESAGIYLDDNTSNVSVIGNTVGGTGRYAVLIHGGDHDSLTGNTFHLDGIYKLGLYQDDQSAGGTNYGMASNVFTGNTIYSSSTATPDSLWDFLDQSSTGIAKPADFTNTYYTPQTQLPSLGSIVDSSPIIKQ